MGVKDVFKVGAVVPISRTTVQDRLDFVRIFEDEAREKLAAVEALPPVDPAEDLEEALRRNVVRALASQIIREADGLRAALAEFDDA